MGLRWTEQDLEAYLRRGQPAPVSEAAFQAAVVKIARQAGWLVWHPYSARKSVPGYPDLTCAHPAGGRPLLCVELKTDTGQVTPAQAAWLEALAGCTGVVSEVWRPADMAAVINRLRGKGT